MIFGCSSQAVHRYVTVADVLSSIICSFNHHATSLKNIIKLNNIWSLCGNKMPTRCNRWFLLQILLLAQHVSGTIIPIIRSSRVLYKWLLPVVFGALVFRLSVWCGAEGYVSGLRAVALVPETCWASNKICNKNHLLHLVGMLFPHY